MQTHISYETAKRLKEFLGKSCGEIGELSLYGKGSPTEKCDIPQFQPRPASF